MSRLFLYIIATSQLVGALLIFGPLDAQLKQTPLANFSAIQVFLWGVIVVVFLLGAVGSILIFSGNRMGLYLSILHQILLLPVIRTPDGYLWVMQDAASVVLFISEKASQFGFSAIFTVGSVNIMQTLRPEPDTSYYGVDILALAFAAYLALVRNRADIIGVGAGSTVSLTRLIIYAIAVLQILAALLPLEGLAQSYQAGGLASVQQPILFTSIGVYLLGLIGALFLFQRSQIGVHLSVLHQIACAPIFINPAQKLAYSFVHIVNLVVFAIYEGLSITFGALASFGLNLSYTFPRSLPTSTIYAVNVFAVFCVVFLLAARSALRDVAGKARAAG